MKIEGESMEEVKKPTEIKPFRCVVCNGHGSVSYGRITCKACEGKGYILVKQELEEDPNKI